MQACQDPYAVIARPRANHLAVRLPADPRRKLMTMPRRTPAVVEQLGIQPENEHGQPPVLYTGYMACF